MQTGINYYVGIELAGGRKGFTCAILGVGLHIEFLGSVTPLEWQTIVANGARVFAALNTPLTMNGGFMADADYRARLKITNNSARLRDMRVCEYQLSQHGMPCNRTPLDVGRFSQSLQRSLKFASEMGMNGFQFWPTADAARQMMETQADAAYAALLGIKPFAMNSLEGRIQRQLLLQSKGLNVPDAMQFFEEVTRHRLLSGKLPDDRVLPAPRLNALVSAYTAWVAANRPGDYSLIGEPEEGQIILPALTFP